MWFWCTSQLYLERFCVHGVNVSDLIWAVRSLSIKHFHHCILHYNMQTKAAASSCCRLRYWWRAHVVVERERRQGEEGPACRIWSLFKSQCFSLAIPGSCRNTVADTELDLRSLQILRAHFLSDFFLFWVRCRPMKISYSANRSPQNLRWPNFSLYLFISPFTKHLLGQTEPRAGP